MSTAHDRLVSTAVLAQRMGELREEITRQKRCRAETDPFFVHTDWMLSEFEEAIRVAALDYRPTSEVSALTGWDPQTLRAKARAVLAGREPGEGWGGLLVKQTGPDYSFCLSTVPVKRTGALKRAS